MPPAPLDDATVARYAAADALVRRAFGKVTG
jgi:hypothetical protein